MKNMFFEMVKNQKLNKFDTTSNIVNKVKYNATSDKLSEYTARKNSLYNIAVKDMVGEYK